MAANASTDNSFPLTIMECETALSCEGGESSQNSSSHDGSYHSSLINELAKMVMNFKAKALLLEDEQETLLSILMNLREEVPAETSTISGLGAVNVVDNLIATLADVNLKVTTKRSSHEEEALHQVNNMISQLVFQAQNEVHSTKELCHVYIRSCYQPGQCTDESNLGEGDSFQSFILRCAPDDKQRIRRRLHGLLNYIDSLLKDIYSPTNEVTEK